MLIQEGLIVTHALTPQGVWNPIMLKVEKKVSHHELVLQHIRKLAYVDRLPTIGEGQNSSKTSVVAWMSHLQNSFKPLAFIFFLATKSGLHGKVTSEDAVLVVEKSVCG